MENARAMEATILMPPKANVNHAMHHAQHVVALRQAIVCLAFQLHALPVLYYANHVMELIQATAKHAFQILGL
jgi:hypothetical protein